MLTIYRNGIIFINILGVTITQIIETDVILNIIQFKLN